MRKVFFVIISMIAVFFIVGGIGAYFQFVDLNKYSLFAGILGSIASIMGLISFTTPRLKAADLKEVGTELVSEVANASAQVHALEEKIQQNKTEITQLELKKAEIELLVRKAATKIFLEERLKAVGLEIADYVGNDKKLTGLLETYNAILRSAKTIDEEITSDERVDLINHVFKIHGEMQNRSLRQRRPRTFLDVLSYGVEIYIDTARRMLTR